MRPEAPRSGVAFFVVIAISTGVSAQPWTEAGPTDRIGVSPAADLAIVGGAAALLAGTELLHLAPARCHWCGAPPGIDAGVHDALTGALLSRKAADTASDVWVAGVAPAAALTAAFVATGPHAGPHAGFRAAVVVVESTAVAAAAVQSIKLLAARTRPYASYGHGSHGATSEGATYDLDAADSHLSFPSGHSAAATSLGVSAAMVATLEASPAAPWLWGAAGALSLGAGALRIVAENHYLTDVLAGAAIGAASGVAIPLLHRRGSLLGPGEAAPGTPAAAAGGPAVSLAISSSARAHAFVLAGRF